MDYCLSTVTVNHFKSYSDKTCFDLHNQFNCITGRNGCGKSAIIDAICCCLGGDKKKLRISTYNDLITHLDNQTSDSCSVELVFACNNKKKKVTITFSAESSGTTTFRFNGKMIPRERLRNVVSSQLGLPIHPSPLFIIQQNQIQNFCCNDPTFLVHYLREINGTNQFLSFFQEFEKQKLHIQQQIDSLTSTLQIKQNQLNQAHALQDNRNKRKTIEKEIMKQQQKLASREKDYEYSRGQELKQRIHELVGENEEVTSQLERIQKGMEEEAVQYQREKEKLDDMKDIIRMEEQRINLLTKEKDTLENAMKENTTQITSLQTEKNQVYQTLQQLENITFILHQLQSQNISYASLQRYAQTTATSQSLLKYQHTLHTLQEETRQIDISIHHLQHQLTSQSESNVHSSVAQLEQLQYQSRQHLLHYPISPPHDYMGLVIELFRFQTQTEFVSCLDRLFSPFCSVHLCRTYESSTELLQHHPHQNLRVWVYEQICKSVPNTLPVLQIQEGSIHLLHPLALCDPSMTHLSNQALFPVYNAVINNTYFLHSQKYPLSDPTHLQSLKQALTKHGIRVISSDGTIHSVGMVSGGQTPQPSKWDEMAQLSNLAFQLKELRHQTELFEELRKAKTAKEQNQIQIESLQQKITAENEDASLHILLHNIDCSLFTTSSSYEELENKIVEKKTENEEQGDFIEKELFSHEIKHQTLTTQLAQITHSLTQINQDLTSHRSTIQTQVRPSSTGNEEYQTLLLKQSQIEKEIEIAQHELDRLKITKTPKNRIEETTTIKQDISHIQEDLKNLSEQLLQLKSVVVQKKGMNVDTLTEECQDLLNHRNIISEGLQLLKEDVEHTMQKIETIDQETFQSISRDFKHFCKQLIPEKEIEMITINPKKLADGIQIRIRNNKEDEWKNSLMELSGGQKSLVSIALVLSQVTYKPFCLYIFDEIDAALDEENTARVVRLINEVISKLQIQIISVSHHSVFQASSTHIIKIGKDEHGSSIILN